MIHDPKTAPFFTHFPKLLVLERDLFHVYNRDCSSISLLPHSTFCVIPFFLDCAYRKSSLQCTLRLEYVYMYFTGRKFNIELVFNYSGPYQMGPNVVVVW